MNLTKNFPAHVGIIMDGNGRWATHRGLSRLIGHNQGMKAVEKTIDNAADLGIKILTFFAFSTENWKRDKKEIEGIFDIVRKYLKDNLNKLYEKNIKIIFMGDISKIPADLAESLQDIANKTAKNSGLIVNLAVNYGSRDEIARAFNNLAKQGKTEIIIEDIQKNLYTADLPDPDLIIRTSGEMRLSNFMLFQSAYSELYFTKVYWPSFNRRHLIKALNCYSKRERRYGGNHKK